MIICDQNALKYSYKQFLRFEFQLFFSLNQRLSIWPFGRRDSDSAGSEKTLCKI